MKINKEFIYETITIALLIGVLYLLLLFAGAFQETASIDPMIDLTPYYEQIPVTCADMWFRECDTILASNM